MKGKIRLPYLLFGFLLLSLYGCPGVNWSETYRADQQQPFDLYALHELLVARPEGLREVTDTLANLTEDSLLGTNYIFIGHEPYYREAAVTTLLDYVERGNTAFIAARLVPEDLAYHLFGDECYYERFEDYYIDDRFPEVYRDSLTTFIYPATDSFELVHIRFWEPSRTSMNVVSERLLCDENLDIQVLGTIDTSGVNFLRIGWGKGDFYFHSNPIFFTNWFVLDSIQNGYPEAALAVLSDGPIYWDEYHRKYRRDPATRTGQPNAGRQYTGGRNLLNGNQALQYIQERKELAFAWYTLLAGVFLFVVFRGRRRQRTIPVLPARENSSRRFIDTISRLVYQKGNHAALAQRELDYLRHHLNQKLGIRWPEGEGPPADLAERTGLPVAVVERAFVEIRVVMARGEMKDGDLLRFYRAIEPLYKL